jgi:hypothetical protein
MGVALSEMEALRLAFCSLNFSLVFQEERLKSGLSGFTKSQNGAPGRSASTGKEAKRGRFAYCVIDGKAVEWIRKIFNQLNDANS